MSQIYNKSKIFIKILILLDKILANIISKKKYILMNMIFIKTMILTIISHLMKVMRYINCLN